MKIITQTNLLAHQKQMSFSIWNAEYPVHLQMQDFQAFDDFLNTLINPTYYLLLNDKNEIAGWASVFLREEVRNFFIILKSAIHNKGFGTILINEIKKNEPRLFGWVIDHDKDVKASGEPYPSPLVFYRQNGFIINIEKRLETGALSAVQIMWEGDPGDFNMDNS